MKGMMCILDITKKKEDIGVIKLFNYNYKLIKSCLTYMMPRFVVKFVAIFALQNFRRIIFSHQLCCGLKIIIRM